MAGDLSQVTDTEAGPVADAQDCLIRNYKTTANNIWKREVKGANWNRRYRKLGAAGRLTAEDWPGDDLFSTRYGGATSEGVVDADGDEYVDPTRGALGSKIIIDGLDYLQHLNQDEYDKLWQSSGGAYGHATGGTKSCAGVAQKIATAQMEALKIMLQNTAATSDERLDALSEASDATRNSISGALMGKGTAAIKAETLKPADIPPPEVSRSGIAYDTVEYREQCFLLSQIFNLVDYRINVLEGEDLGSTDIGEGGGMDLDRMVAQYEQALKKNPKAEMDVEYKPLPYLEQDLTPGGKNACLMVDDLHPYGFLNRLTQYPTQQQLLSIKTGDLSQLQPQIRLFRINDREVGGEMQEFSQEIHFETSTTTADIESLMKPTGKRGFGAGIKDFTVTYEASNPFAIKKSISATLTIFANTFDELTADRGGYRYIDLALKTGGIKQLDQYRMQHANGELNPKERSRLYNLSKLNFRLKAVVGWQQPQGSGVRGISNSRLTQALENSFITINLTPTIHTFDFDEMGRVNFKIEYLAYIEDFFDEPGYSIFGSVEIVRKQKEREQAYEAIKRECRTEDLQKFKEKMGEETAKDLALARSTMFTILMSSKKLRWINLNYSSLMEFQQKGAFFDMEAEEKKAFEDSIGRVNEKTKLNASLMDSVKKYGKKTKGSATGTKDRRNANSTQKIALVYFYVSDLLDVILGLIDDFLNEELGYYQESGATVEALLAKTQAHEQIIQGLYQDSSLQTEENFRATLDFERSELDLMRIIKLRDNFRRYRLLLGPIEIVNPQNTADVRCVNIGDLPISFSYFMEWLTGRTLKKDKPYYPISNFMNDFINGLINGFINDNHCFPRGRRQAKQKTYLQQASITAYKSPPPPENNKPPTLKQIAAAPDTITKLLSTHRTSMEQIYGYDVSRLHLDYHYSEDGSNGPIKEFPILQISGPQGSPITHRDAPAYETNYAIYFAGRTAPDNYMNGDLGEDQPRGIMHYTAGKDVGIIKNIKFTKTETPGLREVRFEQEGYDGLSQLREVYNVTIDTYANVNAFPGTYVFVNPRGLVPNMHYLPNSTDFTIDDLSSYGLGGYYMIIRSTHSFGPGKADTRIDAIWVSEIHKIAGEGSAAPTPVPDEARPEKCNARTQYEARGGSGARDAGDNVDKPAT